MAASTPGNFLSNARPGADFHVFVEVAESSLALLVPQIVVHSYLIWMNKIEISSFLGRDRFPY